MQRYTDLKLQILGLRWTGVKIVKSIKNACKLEAPLLEVAPGTISRRQQTDIPAFYSLVPNKRCFENKIQIVGGQCMILTEESPFCRRDTTFLSSGIFSSQANSKRKRPQYGSGRFKRGQVQYHVEDTKKRSVKLRTLKGGRLYFQVVCVYSTALLNSFTTLLTLIKPHKPCEIGNYYN